jgi:hypothetical protein
VPTARSNVKIQDDFHDPSDDAFANLFPRTKRKDRSHSLVELNLETAELGVLLMDGVLHRIE